MRKKYGPSKRSLTVFCVNSVILILCNVLFAVGEMFSLDNDDYLATLHLALMISSFAFGFFCISYLMRALEKLCSYAKPKLNSFLLALLGILNIIITYVVLSLFVFMDQNRLYEVSTIIMDDLSGTMYFQGFDSLENITVVAQVWAYWVSFFCVFSSIVFIVSAVRQFKRRKQIKCEANAYEYAEQVEKYLGFKYESCEFYKQTQLQYDELAQRDGTRGEFEAFVSLWKNGFEDAEYIFNRNVPKEDGLFTELDLIVVHRKGIVVIENKHYTTKVYGKAAEHDLTVIGNKGNKISIYNPIKQNENHVTALKSFLLQNGLYDDALTPVYSVVVFTAENGDDSDEIIAGIDVSGVYTKVCTSRNLPYVVTQLLNNANFKANVDVARTKEVLSALTVRSKSRML